MERRHRQQTISSAALKNTMWPRRDSSASHESPRPATLSLKPNPSWNPMLKTLKPRILQLLKSPKVKGSVNKPLLKG